MADTAGGNLASGARLARRCVTRVATVVCSEIRGYGKPNAAIDWRTVTTRAASLRASGAGVMLRVIKLHVERLVEARRKSFQRRVVAADVGMTDLAHRDLRCRELATMTIGAGFVTGKARCGGVVGAFVTRVAGEGAVALARVEKFRVVELRPLR